MKPTQPHEISPQQVPSPSRSDISIPESANAATPVPAEEQQGTKQRSYRRACETCRKLKVQCIFDNPKSIACKRCASAHRNCVVAARRPRHVASHIAIADLERKVEALTKSLQDMECSATATAASQSSQVDCDVLTNGTVTEETATGCYEHFTRHMLPHMPIIFIPAGLSANEMRKSKPVLFLAIINSASGLLSLDVQQSVNQALSRVLASKVLVDGEKSIELIQAMQLSCLWHYPPRQFETLKFYQWIHNAAVMAIDIGLSRRRVINSPKSIVGLDELPKSKAKLPDPTTAEARRTWVGCFFLASGTAQNMRRPNLIGWSTYLADCVRYLETSPEALPSDKLLCRWVRLQHFADDVGLLLSIEDPGACVGLSDPAIRYGMKGLEAQLKSLTSTPLDGKSMPLELGELLTKLYMHEVALHTGSAEDSDMQPPFTEEALKSLRPTQAEKLSAAHIESLSTTLATVHAAFSVFLSMSAETLREIPTFHFVRLIYAAIVLVKLAMDTTISKSAIGRMFSLEDLKVDEYLSKLVVSLNQAAEENHCANASKFGFVISMLQLLYHKDVLKDQWDASNRSATGFNASRSRKHAAEYENTNQDFQSKTSCTSLGDLITADPSLSQAPLYFQDEQSYGTGQSLSPFSFVANPQQQLFAGQQLALPDLSRIWPNVLDFQSINIDFGSFDMNDFSGFFEGNGAEDSHG